MDPRRRNEGGEASQQVAKLLNVARSTVYKLCAEGKLGHVRVSNAIRVIPGVAWALLRSRK